MQGNTKIWQCHGEPKPLLPCPPTELADGLGPEDAPRYAGARIRQIALRGTTPRCTDSPQGLLGSPARARLIKTADQTNKCDSAVTFGGIRLAAERTEGLGQ